MRPLVDGPPHDGSPHDEGAAGSGAAAGGVIAGRGHRLLQGAPKGYYFLKATIF